MCSVKSIQIHKGGNQSDTAAHTNACSIHITAISISYISGDNRNWAVILVSKGKTQPLALYPFKFKMHQQRSVDYSRIEKQSRQLRRVMYHLYNNKKALFTGPFCCTTLRKLYFYIPLFGIRNSNCRT